MLRREDTVINGRSDGIMDRAHSSSPTYAPDRAADEYSISSASSDMAAAAGSSFFDFLMIVSMLQNMRLTA